MNGNISAPLFALLIASVSLVSAQPADAPAGFRSPSSNIFCEVNPADNGFVLRCDVMKISNRPPPRPKDCDLDWGRAFEISDNGATGQRLCYGDTVMNDGFAPLAYGATWQRHGFSCQSEPSGVRCVNPKGHGFELSRNAQRVF
jgi:hypothetical protein